MSQSLSCSSLWLVHIMLYGRFFKFQIMKKFDKLCLEHERYVNSLFTEWILFTFRLWKTVFTVVWSLEYWWILFSLPFFSRIKSRIRLSWQLATSEFFHSSHKLFISIKFTSYFFFSFTGNCPLMMQYVNNKEVIRFDYWVDIGYWLGRYSLIAWDSNPFSKITIPSH